MSSRYLTTALAVLLIGAGLWLYLRPRAAPPLPARDAALLPDTAGQIEQVVCHVNSARRAVLRNAELVTNIVNALPPRIKVVLTVNDRADFTVANNPWPDRVRFIELAPDQHYTIWPQDPFLVLRTDAGKTRLLVSAQFDRADDRQIAQRLADELGYECDVSTLSFEGGNITADEQTVFLGADTVMFNIARLRLDEAEVLRRFETQLGRPVLVIGPSPQPVGHLDMMLTPIGGRRLVLADPAAGADLARQQLDDDPDSVAAFEQHCEETFFGRPDIRELTDAEGHTIAAPEVVGRTADVIEYNRAIAADLDAVADELTERGYDVTRIPFLQAEPKLDPPRDNDSDTDAPRRSRLRSDYPTLTYNNVLTEHTDDGDVVYVPQYGWPAFDDAARDVWQTLGYQVVPIPGFSASAIYGGALRCTTKVLERTQ